MEVGAGHMVAAPHLSICVRNEFGAGNNFNVVIGFTAMADMGFHHFFAQHVRFSNNCKNGASIREPALGKSSPR